ncbi:MAG: bifunctional 5,10-methylenetetrahydrofolate dehydrogenase/5,10-methenyltetrahydrofolate cyclohydrolase [Chloracidobacterium sp.]|nr:bifunctional 5,10-methylenetetrahydrofolate dehydrogenase/5,10-methenyltetrahydrofolate cyclohydrolase [Chloracidobacterium sp.]MDW8216609.1 bifunctional 5,10-methylenetetrahydrofolate dehydrogenase/5,10-methenyltetrahydrofolate cyclohydrolase [Acidobacteriota bacterium]
MGAQILDGALVASKLNAETAERCRRLTTQGVRPGLAAVLVGDNPASRTYVTAKAKTCTRLGLHSEVIPLPAETTTTELLALVATLNARTDIHGILVQLPLPPQIDAPAVIRAIDPDKDVDGFHPVNVGRLALKQEGFVPCTPAGVLALLDHYDLPLRGRRAVVLGRSAIVGLPLALLLLHRDATVTVCHSRTPDLAAVAQTADILIAAIGRTALVTADFIRPGAVVVDVGINRITTPAEVETYFGGDPTRLAELEKKGYTLIGDVHPLQAAERAGYLTPVPGGVGPLTIAMLMRNTTLAAERACRR